MFGWWPSWVVSAVIRRVLPGPNTVSWTTTYVFGNPDDLRYSLALMHAVLGPLAAFIFWKGLRAYGEAYARARAAQG